MTQREIDIESGKIRVDDDGNEVVVEFAPPLEEHPLYKKHKEFYEGTNPDEIKAARDAQDSEDEQSDVSGEDDDDVDVDGDGDDDGDGVVDSETEDENSFFA